jgi:serine carboxypeptidase-like clade 4
VEWLTRSLNLFPKDPVNVVHDDQSVDFVPGKIVEKKISFFGDSDGLSVENLGHHAGYYSLPRSKSAR